MNKKALACLFGLALAVCMNAGVVSQQMAENLAVDFLNKKITPVKGSTNSLDLELAMEQSVMKKSSTVPLFYVFNYGQDEGFIIMSANSETPAVLGWSAHGSFDPDNLSDGLQYLIGHYTEALKLSASDNSQSSGTVAKSGTKAFTGQRLLQTAEWGQDYPFNANLPNEFLTGCGATAMSIIMKYYKWPDVGIGEYSVWNKIINRSLTTTLNTFYDWDNMPATRQQSYSQKSANALAKLFYDVSVCMNTEFNTAQNGGSGTTTFYSTIVLPKYFKYKRNTVISRESYTDQKWDSILHVEIDNGRPVYYTGSSINKTNGHAFVVDGYDNDLYHINFGWKGTDNGYYALSNLIPVLNKHYNFSYNQNAIIHIEPDKEEHNYTFSPVLADDGVTTLTSSVKSVKKNQPFYIFMKKVFSYEKRNAYIALMDSDMNVKELIGPSIEIKNGVINIGLVQCKSTKDAEPSDLIGLISFDPKNYIMELIDYATGDNPQNKHCWIPAYDNVLKYHNISYDINASNVKASLYQQTEAVAGMPFNVIVQPTNANYFNNDIAVNLSTDNPDDIVQTGTLTYYNMHDVALGNAYVFTIVSMTNTQDITLHVNVYSTSETDKIPAGGQSDSKIYNMNGYEVPSATEPGVYIIDGVKTLQE